MQQSFLSRVIIPSAKLILGLAIVGYLLVQARGHQEFDDLWAQPKDWSQFVLALIYVAAAVLLGFFRWYLLVRAIGLPFTLRDAVRLGSLGYALNFVGPGGVGGDLFKSVALAREHRTQRSEAVATVIADRVVGLLSLLAIATVGTLASGTLWDTSASLALRSLGGVVVTALVLGLLMGGLLMAPGKVSRQIVRLLARLPRVGRVALAMFTACQAMSRRLDRLIPAVGIGLVTHFLLVLSFDAVSRGLPLASPSLIDHLQIVPLAETAGVLPITPGGLGTTEAALASLYEASGANYHDGVIVALGQRIVMLLVAAVAIGYFFIQRRAVRKSLQAAEVAMQSV